MESTLKISKLKFLLLGFFLLNLFLKFLFIKSTPPSATYDEIIYVAEAQSIVKYGTDLTGNWRPWHLEPSDSYYTELTSTVLTPGFILFPNNPILAAKFVPILLGSLIPILLGLIVFKLTSKKGALIATILIATLNPWIFQFSRMGYDSLFSVGFYLIGIVSLLYFKNWKKLWSLIPFFLGFYQYQGHKVLLVPLVGIVFLYIYFKQFSIKDILNKYKKIILNKELLATFFVLSFSLILTISYLVRLPNLTSGERISEFSFYDQTELASEVNKQRRISLDSPLTSIYSNKYIVLSRVLADRLFNSFNLKRLFIEGHRGLDTFTVLDYGFFHLIDAFVIVLSLAFIIRNSKDLKPLYFILAFIIIGALPNVIRTGSPWITFRGSFAFLGLVMLMGAGIFNFYDELKFKYKNILAILIYLICASPFFFLYFVRYPVTHGAYIGIYERIMANYIQRIDVNSKSLIVPDRADATFDYMIAYSSLLTNENKEQVNLAAQTKKFQINNTLIASNCPIDIAETNEDTTVFVYFFKKPCAPGKNNEKTTEIKSFIDGGSIFTVYNDNLCSKYDLGGYPDIKENVLNIEELSDQEFCQSFFSK
jgi:hypothetical protein